MTSQLKDAVEFVSKQAVEAAGAAIKAKIIELPHEPKGTYAIVKADGTVDVRASRNPPRDDALGSVDQVADYAAYLATLRVGGDPLQSLVQVNVWLSPHSVLIEGEDQENRVDSLRIGSGSVPLNRTPEFAALAEQAEEPEPMTHRDFVKFLRIKLAGCADDTLDALIRTIRKISFAASDQGTSDVSRGRESMSRSLLSEVAAEAGDIPEQIALRVRLFDDRAMQVRRKIRCLIEVDAVQKVFTFVPLAADVKQAIDEEMGDLASALLPQMPDGSNVFYRG